MWHLIVIILNMYAFEIICNTIFNTLLANNKLKKMLVKVSLMSSISIMFSYVGIFIEHLSLSLQLLFFYPEHFFIIYDFLLSCLFLTHHACNDSVNMVNCINKLWWNSQNNWWKCYIYMMYSTIYMYSINYSPRSAEVG